MEEELLILVDENDNEQGTMDKISVHKTGALHRAFSVFIFTTEFKLLLQQRSDNKYHSAGLWSNTCCGHPRQGERIIDAVKRRLKEEMGLECDTVFVFSFIYRAELNNGLIEHEYDHVYLGVSNSLPVPNADEVKDWKHITLAGLRADIDNNPGHYTEWLKICLPKVVNFME